MVFLCLGDPVVFSTKMYIIGLRSPKNVFFYLVHTHRKPALISSQGGMCRAHGVFYTVQPMTLPLDLFKYLRCRDRLYEYRTRQEAHRMARELQNKNEQDSVPLQVRCQPVRPKRRGLCLMTGDPILSCLRSV